MWKAIFRASALPPPHVAHPPPEGIVVELTVDPFERIYNNMRAVKEKYELLYLVDGVQNLDLLITRLCTRALLVTTPINIHTALKVASHPEELKDKLMRCTVFPLDYPHVMDRNRNLRTYEEAMADKEHSFLTTSAKTFCLEHGFIGIPAAETIAPGLRPVYIFRSTIRDEKRQKTKTVASSDLQLLKLDTHSLGEADDVVLKIGALADFVLITSDKGLARDRLHGEPTKYQPLNEDEPYDRAYSERVKTHAQETLRKLTETIRNIINLEDARHNDLRDFLFSSFINQKLYDAHTDAFDIFIRSKATSSHRTKFTHSDALQPAWHGYVDKQMPSWTTFGDDHKPAVVSVVEHGSEPSLLKRAFSSEKTAKKATKLARVARMLQTDKAERGATMSETSPFAILGETGSRRRNWQFTDRQADRT